MQYKNSELNKKLTEKQAAIVSSEIYPKYLRAGAGTGKTEVLVQKIGYILDSDVDCSLSNFAIITFTNKATEEMQNRISEMLYKKWLISADSKSEKYRKDIETVCMSDICTIHSFCENLLREYGFHINLAANYKIKSFKKEMTDIISAVVNENFDNSLLSNIPEYVISRLITILLINNSNRGIKLSHDILDALCVPVANNNYWNAFKVLFMQMYQKAYDKIGQEKSSQNVLTPNALLSALIDAEGYKQKALEVVHKAKEVTLSLYQTYDAYIKSSFKMFEDEGRIRMYLEKAQLAETDEDMLIAPVLFCPALLKFCRAADDMHLFYLGFEFYQYLKPYEDHEIRLTFDDIGKLFMDKTRCDVIRLLRTKESYLLETSRELKVPNNTLYYHMQLLYDAGVVLGRNEGRRFYYRLNEKYFDAVKKLGEGFMEGKE